MIIIALGNKFGYLVVRKKLAFFLCELTKVL